ncbi:MAG: beta-glucuronidase [Lachnospiraceae bacterium]|nr:beta-glucuronidase [Lachnospiraceae bacterium]
MLYPEMTESRLVIRLDGIWNFKKDEETASGESRGMKERWYEKPLRSPMTMPVPSSYNDIKDDISLRDHVGPVFYQRPFALPSHILKNERIMLRFDSVIQHATVYVNGTMVAAHSGGCLPFEAELTGCLKEGTNLLTVAVDNRIDYTTLPVGGKASMMGGLASMMGGLSPQKKKTLHPNFDFFHYAGINRSVRIYTTPKAHIEDVTLTSSVKGKDAVISYEIETKGKGDCSIELFDHSGRRVAKGEGLTGKLTVKSVHLWQPLHAYLYDVKVRFGTDVYTTRYGVRTVQVKGKRFLINGKPFYFKGYGKHEDTFPAGRGINEPMNAKDISIMKWQGANSFRTSHYPYSEEMMRLCDEEGIVVIDETTAVGVNLLFGGGANFGGQKVTTFDKKHGLKTLAHHKEVVRDLIKRDKNHACVVLWSIANEPDSSGPGALQYFKPLFDLARKLDPQKRPVTLVSVQSAGSPKDDVSSRLSDVICLNRYYGWYAGGPDLDWPIDLFCKELAAWERIGKPVIITEYGADTVMGFHDTTPVMYTEEYQTEYYKANNAALDRFKCVVGEQVWNFADFATSQSLLRVQGNKKGLFTRDRKPKLAAHYFRERWHGIPDFSYKK